MLHIVLFLLKLIGIILASIIGILLILLLTVLFLPIRYRINGGNTEKVFGIAKATWLFHTLNFQITYLNRHLAVRFYILGKSFYDSDRPKEKREKRKKRKDKGRTEKEKTEKEIAEEELTEKEKTETKRIETEKIEKVKEEKAQEEKTQEEKTQDEKIHNEKTQDEKIQDEKIQNEAERKTEKVETEEEKTKRPLEPGEKNWDEPGRSAATRISDTGEDAGTVLIRRPQEERTDFENFDTEEEKKSSAKEEEAEEKNPSYLKWKKLWIKIKAFLIKIKEKINNAIAAITSLPKKINQLICRVKEFFKGIEESVIRIRDKILELRRIWNNLRDFLQNETNKAGMKHTFRSLKKLLLHIKPSKVRANLEFGTGDPCQTGQVLAAISVFYGFYGKSVQIIPDFEEKKAVGTVFIKGRIRIFTLLIICIKLLLDKNFKELIKNMKAFKEEL